MVCVAGSDWNLRGLRAGLVLCAYEHGCLWPAGTLSQLVLGGMGGGVHFLCEGPLVAIHEI